jgi:aminopeptidase N
MLTLVLAAALTALPPDSLTGPGVSDALARWRAARVRDVRYDLSLDVSRGDTAYGTVVVRFRRTGAADAILDFRGPWLGPAVVNGRRAEAEANGAHVRIPAAALREGENQVELAFRALVAPTGASIIRYRDATDGAEYLYTLLVPADANQLFPCFDQPDLKARVTLTLRTPHGWVAVANGERLRDSSIAVVERGRTEHRFRETEPISTYLIAFAAGPWETVTLPADSARGSRPISLYVRRSRAREVDADTLLAVNRRALAWLEGYFARPFPFRKFDVVLAPAFPFGGMEHPGAIFYNEERFVFRERPTLAQQLGRKGTIYHEVAHQWFGDLVTMRWFDDLWLKEGFSTYMAAKMQQALDPGTGAWKTFYLRNKPLAYEMDVTEGTSAVWQPLANLDQAKSNYGPIVYNKAPAVLKQLEFVVGDTAFRRGVQRFLAAHAYGNATWRDLLDAVGAAAGRSLAEFGEHWILRPGVPVFEQRLYRNAAGTDGGVVLTQRPAQPALSGERPWPVATQVMFIGPRVEYDRSARIVDRTATVAAHLENPRRVAPLFAWPNADDHAYAVFLLDSASLAIAEADVAHYDDDLLRAQLWGALWDLVREARYSPSRFLALAMRELPGERDEQIVPAVLGRVTRAAGAYLSDAQRDTVLPQLERALRAMAADTLRSYGVRRAYFDALVAVARTPSALAYLDSLIDSTRVLGEPLRGPTRWAIVARLVSRGAPTAARRLAEETLRDSTSEGRRRAFVAGAARPDPAVKAAYFRRYFADSSLNEEWVTASLGAFNDVTAPELTAPYLVPALDSLPFIQRNRRIFFLGSWLEAFLGGQTGEGAERRVRDWLAAHPALPADLRRKVLQYADELRRTVRIRRAFAEAR